MTEFNLHWLLVDIYVECPSQTLLPGKDFGLLPQGYMEEGCKKSFRFFSFWHIIPDIHGK